MNPPRGENGDIRTVKISEAGQGFPSVGEIIYDAKNNELLKVLKIRSGIQTRQWQANWIIADVEYYGDPTDISKAKFDDLRNLGIEDEPESSNPPRGEITVADVDAAIRDEIDAIQMYGSWADRLTDPTLKVVFQNIAKEELKHKGALEELALILRQRGI